MPRPFRYESPVFLRVAWDCISCLLARGVAVITNEGVGAFARRACHLFLRFLHGRGNIVRLSRRGRDKQYEKWRERHALTSTVIHTMRANAEHMIQHPIVSIIMPLASVNAAWLRRAVGSVLAQAYPYWELCVVCHEPLSQESQAMVATYGLLDVRIKVLSVPAAHENIQLLRDILPSVTGEYVGFLDPRDELAVDAAFVVVQQINESSDLDLFYSDEDKIDSDGRHIKPFFKPGWSPDLLLSMDYISRWCVIRRTLLEELRNDHEDVLLGDTFDLSLHITERTDRICHIAKVLYHSRVSDESGCPSDPVLPSVADTKRVAVEKALARRGERGRVKRVGAGLLSVNYYLDATPLVSVIIPTKDNWQLLEQCVMSIERKTTYAGYEIVVIDNGTIVKEAVRYLEGLGKKWKVHRFPGPFNYSKINNFGASVASGDLLLFLNDDTEVISAHWITAMVAQAQRRQVGAVGAKLLFPNGTLQHAGVVLGIGGVAGHAFRHSMVEDSDYPALANALRNCSAVTGACMLVPRSVFDLVKGFDPQLSVEYNDVDLCLRIIKEGYRIVYTPDAELYHYESATRRGTRCLADEERTMEIWGSLIRRGDPYYNPNLTLIREDWSLAL